ncbi:MAG: 5'-nucleotidase C-terminal domain-containing protein [Oscillospiraceae bacterium]|nr:5'-nucleotidase C-terminal domain-containing protein [Oscillospiraceae bacterium]
MKKRALLSFLLALTLLCSLWSGVPAARAADSTEINIFGIGDFGGKLDPMDSPTGDPGGAKIVGAMKALTGSSANAIVVAGGTSYTGAAISKLNHGTPVNEMYKAMGVEYVNIGNHDFDWSDIDTRETCFATWQNEGGFSFLNANVYYTDGAKAGQRLFTPYAVKEIAGVRVGFFGVIDPGNYGAISALNVKGLEFRPAAAESLEVVKTLRNEEKCDVIVAMPHIASAQAMPDLSVPVGEGALTQYITELNAACKSEGVKGIDAAFASQCETAHLAVVDGVPLVKAKNFGQIIAQLNIVVADGSVTVTPSLHPLTQIVVKDGENEVSVLGSTETTREETPEDTEFKAVYDRYNDIAMKVLDDPRGISDTDFSEADAASKFAYQKWYLRQNWYYVNYVAGEPIVAYFQNCGGIRHIAPTEVKKGDPISLRLIQMMAPFDNYVVTMNMTGKDIKTILSGVSSYGTYNSLRQYGLDVTYASGEYEENAEVVSVKLNGKEIEDDATYRIGCNTFLSDGPGKDNMDFSAGTDVKKYDIINSNAVLEAILHQSAGLKSDTVFVDYGTTNSKDAAIAPANEDAAVTVAASGLSVGANAVTVEVVAPYTDPNRTDGTVKVTHTVNVVRGFADQASIPAGALDAVKALSANGIFVGNGRGEFAPNALLTYNELAVLAARAAGAKLVPGGHWAAPAMNWCVEQGVLAAGADGSAAVSAADFDAAMTKLAAIAGGSYASAGAKQITRSVAAEVLAGILY